MNKEDLTTKLQATIKSLLATSWEGAVNTTDIARWLEQFGTSPQPEDDEQLHALYLLTHFLYFDQASVRELLRSVYRDLYRAPHLQQIRRKNGDTLDLALIEGEFAEVLAKTRFLGMGNPSESGVHLLYYFRQENQLTKDLFMNAYAIFDRAEEGVSGPRLRDPTIKNYVYLDDLCGSGSQAREYATQLVAPLKKAKPDVKVDYFVLFATSEGIQAVRSLGCFDKVSAVFELDASFKSLDPKSRIFNPETPPFIRTKIRQTCETIGRKLWPRHPLGYKDGQLLIGFSHNTPDNTLPIFWATHQWRPVFRRYHKEL